MINQTVIQEFSLFYQNTEGTPEDFEFVDEDSQPSVSSQGDVEGNATDEVDPLEVAIAQMRAMGFDDESGTGWLAQLLKAKNYDIGKVLDAIHYNSGKQ